MTSSSFFILRTVARILACISIGVMGFMSVSSMEAVTGLTTAEGWLFICFPFGVAVGLGWACWRELPGSIVSLVSLSAFYILHYFFSKTLPSGPWFLIFSSPAVLFLVVGIMRGRKGVAM